MCQQHVADGPYLSCLLQGVTKDSRKNRLAAKYVESEFEKVDRLMEICFRSVLLLKKPHHRTQCQPLQLFNDPLHEQLYNYISLLSC